MLVANQASERANWQVLWKSNGRIVKKDFDHDLSGALALYIKAVAAGKKGATLRCKNMGFPPPEKYMPRFVSKRVRDPRTGKPKVVEGWVYPMKKLNMQGIWWCPYCMKMRQFQSRSGVRVGNITMKDPGFRCPMCGASHKDHHVRKWNPLMIRVAEDYMPRPRASATKTRRR